MWFVQFSAVLAFGFSRPFLPFYLEDLGLTDPAQVRLWAGMFHAAASVTMIFVTPLWGYLADRYGRKPMSLRAALGGGLAMLALGLARTPEALLAVRVAQGLFTGTVTANLTLVVTTTPREKTGLAVGVMNSAIFAGSSISPLIGGLLADWTGYRASFFWGAAVLGVSFLLVLLLIKEDFQRPEGGAGSFFGDMREVLRRPGVLVITVLVIPLYGVARIMPAPVRPLLVRELAETTVRIATRSGVVSSGAGVATVLAGLVIGVLSSRVDLRRVAILCALAGALLGLPVLLVTQVWQLAFFVFVMSLFIGGLDPATKVIVTQRVPPHRRGALFGLIGSTRAVGMAVGSISGGGAAALLGLRSVYVIAAVLLVVAAVAIGMMDRRVATREQGPA
jgi:DHA1 family multidrug resistance protein-like MFS transporter